MFIAVCTYVRVPHMHTQLTGGLVVGGRLVVVVGGLSVVVGFVVVVDRGAEPVATMEREEDLEDINN